MIVLRRLEPLLERAGLPVDQHGEFLDCISAFTTLMIVLLKANEKHDAPNYLTFAIKTPEEVKYEITVRKADGKTPCEVISELEETLKELELDRVRLKARLIRARTALRDIEENWDHEYLSAGPDCSRVAHVSPQCRCCIAARALKASETENR